MPVDPLVPYTDLVTAGSETVDATNGETLPPVGVESAITPYPAMPTPLSQEAWQMMDPAAQAAYIAEVVTGGDAADDEDEYEDDEPGGNFIPDVRLDPGQAVGVPPEMQVPQAGPITQLQPPRQTGPGGFLSAPEPLKDSEPESRKDDIGYRYSEFVKGLSQRFNHLFGMDDGGDAGREHLMNAWDPDRNNTPDLPVSEAQIGMPKGSYRADGSGVPQAVMAPGGEAPASPAPPVSLYSQSPGDWKYVSDDPQKSARILGVAQSMIGNPPGAGDLVPLAYGAAGIDVPDLIDFQMEMGERVPLNELKPGDLVGWSDSPNSMFRDNVGIMLMDGTAIRAPRMGEGTRVFDLSTVPRDALYGVRISHPDRDPRTGGGVTLNEVEQEQYREAMDAVHKVLSGVLGGISKKKNEKKRKKKNDRGGNGRDDGQGRVSSKNRRSGRGDINDGDSWEPRGDGGKKYSGIGATK